jgi:hypothetical protein
VALRQIVPRVLRFSLSLSFRGCCIFTHTSSWRWTVCQLEALCHTGVILPCHNDTSKVLHGFLQSSLDSKPEGKRQLRQTRCRWENNIKIYPKQGGYLCGLDSAVSGLVPVAHCQARDNDTPFSVKGGGFLDRLNYYSLPSDPSPVVSVIVFITSSPRSSIW